MKQLKTDLDCVGTEGCKVSLPVVRPTELEFDPEAVRKALKKDLKHRTVKVSKSVLP